MDTLQDRTIALSAVDRPSATRVRRIELPAEASALSTLARIDYHDAFAVDAGLAPGQLPEQWLRTMLRDAPVATRLRLIAGWTALGLKLAPRRSGGSLLGWQVRRSNAEYVLLGADSRIGMPAELLLKQAGAELVFATLVQQNTGLARAAWALVEPVHLRVVPALLVHAARRVSAVSDAATR